MKATPDSAIKSWSLRPLRTSDAASLHKMCWPHTSYDTVREMLDRVLHKMAQQRALGLVVDVEGSGVGYGQVTRWPRVAEISDLIIHETYQGHGIGTQMIHRLIQTACGWGMTKAEIGSALSNPRALALYHRLGFKDERQIDLNLGSGPEPVIYLSMTLKP